MPVETRIEEKEMSSGTPMALSILRPFSLWREEQADPVDIAIPRSERARTMVSPPTPGKLSETMEGTNPLSLGFLSGTTTAPLMRATPSRRRNSSDWA